MLARSKRLASEKDIALVFRKGRALHAPFWTLRYLQTLGPTRVTFVVSIKVAKSAVQRNRFKRVLRAAIRQFYPSLSLGDYAFLVKSSMPKTYTSRLASTDLESFFNKHKLLK